MLELEAFIFMGSIIMNNKDIYDTYRTYENVDSYTKNESQSKILNEKKVHFNYERYDVEYLHKDIKIHNITLYELLLVFLFMLLVFIYTIPNIFIKNEIYYISRDISELRTKRDALFEENENLKRSIEMIRYKNEILDPLDVIYGKN